MSALQRTALLGQSVRRITTTAIKNEKIKFSPVDPKFKANQERFQIPDGTLIHVKGGFGDQILYRTTTLLVLIGIGCVGNLIYTLGFPKKA